MAFIEMRTPQKFTNPDGLIEIINLDEGLVADWDADILTGANGSTVSAWPAGGSLGLVADQVSGSNGLPTLAVGAINGHNAVAFNGEQALRALGNLTSGSTTIAFAYRVDSIPAGAVSNYVFDFGGGTSGFASFHTTSNYIWQHRSGGTVTRVNSGAAPQPGQWAVFVGRFSGGTARLIGTPMLSEVEVSGLGEPTLSNVVIGAEYRGLSRLTGRISAIKVYDRALSDTEATSLLDVLAHKYGL